MRPGLFLLVALIAAGTAAYFVWKQTEARRAALAQLCAERGWTYTRRDDAWVARLRGDVPLFRRGNGGRRCDNVIAIPGERPMALFDFSYVERSGSGKDSRSRTVRHAVAVVALPHWLPSLRLAGEHVLSRLGSAVGFRDIEVESAEFNRRFRVAADDRTHAFDILHPQAIEFLMAQPIDCWELTGGRLVVHKPGRWDAAQYAPAHALLEGFITLVPDYVWRKHGAGP